MRTSINQQMGKREWFFLIMLSVLWGGSFFFSKVALDELQPLSVVLGRVAIAAFVLNIVVVLSGQRMPLSLHIWSLFIVMGILNNLIPFSLIFWGQIHIASGLASILNATTPLWTVLLAQWFTADERLTLPRFAGVVFGIFGVVCIIGPDTLQGLGIHIIAQLAVVGAAISYACAGIFGKRFSGIPPLVTATGQVTSTTLLMIPITLLVDHPWIYPLPHVGTWSALLGLALLSTALAYVLYFRLLASAGATNLLLVTFLIPVSALLLGTFFLGERLTFWHFMGMGCIGVGLAAIDGRLLQWLRSRMRQRTDTTSHQPDDYSI